MRHPFQTLRQALAAPVVRLRRYRNWCAGASRAAPAMPFADGRRAWPQWPLVLAVLGLACAGAAVIVSHALRLGGVDDTDGSDTGVAVYRDALPGAVIDVPGSPGAHVAHVAGGAVLALNGMHGHAPVRIDLCSRVRADGRLLPLRLGQTVDETAPRGKPLPATVLAAGDAPAVQVDGAAAATAALRLSWRGREASWISDDATAHGRLLRHGWLVWDGGALRFERRAAAACPQAGELVVQLYRPQRAGAPPARCCTVLAFPVHGKVVAGTLPPGRHVAPAAAATARHAREDQALFDALRTHGLLRVLPDGVIEVAPRDLLAWAAAAPADRAAPLAAWENAAGNPAAMRVLKRLYRQADGAYVLRQIDIHNSERRLLAWRAPATRDGVASPAGIPAQPRRDARGAASGAGIAAASYGQASGWRLLADGAPLPGTDAMPGAAARLFDQLPQGWAPWRRARDWPQGAALSLVHAGGGATPLRLMVAGRIGRVEGARIQSQRDACTGNGCATPGDVTELWLQPDGGGPVAVAVSPLPAAAAPGDARYRHVDVERGVPVWRSLGGAPGAGGSAAMPAPAWQAALLADGPRALAQPAARQVRITDRHGVLLWADGAATAGAQAAGLAPLLGVAPQHMSGVAGMLARMPHGGTQAAALTLDLPLQQRAQAIVECLALRRGRWDGAACSGGTAPPPERQAGLVLLDAYSGAILAAAGAGHAPAGAFNWAEVRDFDRANPARSPLRLPAWQHDGGAHRSPGSTFKVVSALGLEFAARSDRQLDALLDGMAPDGINLLARSRGYDFGTAEPSYPAHGRARITNYRDQGLEHRAQEGKLGLKQALAHSQNTWFAWTAEWSDGSLLGLPDGGMPDVQALEPGALDTLRPIVAAARRLGFGAPMRLDGGLLPPAYRWSAYDALQATPSRADPVHTRHEVRQMAIGLRMQATPLQMALVSGAIGQGAAVAPHLLQGLNGRAAAPAQPVKLDARLDRIRAGMKGVIDGGTAAGVFAGPAWAGLRGGLYGKTGTAPTGEGGATVWFTGWLEPGSLPGQAHRLAFAVFASHSEASGGEHAAPVIAALLADSTVRGRIARIAGKEGEIAAYPLK